MFGTVNKAIKNYMTKKDHVSIPKEEHKEMSASLARLNDFLERFVEANQILINDHRQKVEQGKKTRRYIPDALFIEATEKMAEILKIFQTVKIRSAIYDPDFEYTVADYYTGLNSYERNVKDSKKVMAGAQNQKKQERVALFIYERVLPVTLTEKDSEELLKVDPLITRIIQIFTEAP